MMKHLLITTAALAAFSASAQELPQPSPKGEVGQTVGLTEVSVTYNRPSARDRKIFGELVPYGKVWRTGANKCTTISFDGPVKIEGQDLAEGTYSIFTIPETDHWRVIFNKNTELWGEGDRKEEEDVLTVKARTSKVELTETFTISFDAVRDDKARMDMSWENTRASITIEADATERALKNIEEAVAAEDADFRVFNSCASFCLDRKMKADEALKWATKSTELESRFWNLHTLAKAQAANGMYKEAIGTAEKSMAMATEANYEPYVKMNQERIAEWNTAMKSKK